jgi:hypothetical protein
LLLKLEDHVARWEGEINILYPKITHLIFFLINLLQKVVVEQKRGVVAASEETFQAKVFKMTTDEDMPAYSGFDFIS